LAAGPVFLVACGSSSTPASNPTTPTPQNGKVNTMVSDASTEDWATIGVKILSIALIPQAGGTNVNVYTAAQSTAPMINLVQLDQLGEILGNVSVPVGTYTGAVVTISGNSADIQLTSSADPSAAFLAVGAAATTVPTAQIQVQGTTGTAPAQIVSLTVNFISNLVVTTTGSNSLDLEFDLGHPAFLVGHLAASGLPIWAVNFNGPLHHHPIPDITRFLLRHTYGTVTAVASDGSSFTMTKDFPIEPPVSPETAVASTNSLQILPDGTNGTLYYDVDADAAGVSIKTFTTLAATLSGKFVRVATRYQSDGTLVAVRVWASSTFNSLWLSPEGHVLHVNTTTDVITVENEVGVGIPLTVNSATQFFFRTPGNGLADATPISASGGVAFLTANNLERGFKIHPSVVDPLASPLVAGTVDIEVAKYDGVITFAGLSSFIDTRNFQTVADDYSLTLPFISSSTANGSDPVTGAAITGFKWWNFTFPTIVTSGSSAISAFDTVTGGVATFGGTAPAISVVGQSYATWADPANLTGWSVPWTVLDPVPLPLGTALTGYASGSFSMSVPLGATAVTVNLSTASGSGTLVYQVDKTAGVVTITPVDITTTAGQTTVTNGLVAATPVEVFGVPQVAGTIQAYVVFYYTGTKPTAID
jgi:hypothetical protein